MNTIESDMKVLLLAPLTAQTGNTSSAQRIRDLLEYDNDVSCQLVSCQDFTSAEDFAEYVRASRCTCVLAIHAYRSGCLLRGCPKPYGVVFGGTDINEHCKERHKMEVMTAVLLISRFTVAFSKPMMLKAKQLWPAVTDRFIHQPQGIVTYPSGDFDFHKYLHLQHKVPLRSHIFLLVAGIRPVKDPLFLVHVFSEWHHQNETVWFVIVGPYLDVQFTQQVKTTVDRLAGVRLIDCLSRNDVHAAIRDVTALVNSSRSEGMSAAILEAMNLNTAVIARNIEGNAAIIQHMHTGLLYDRPQEFIEQAKMILFNSTLKMKLTNEAKKYVTMHHTIEEEKKCYKKLVKKLCHL